MHSVYLRVYYFHWQDDLSPFWTSWQLIREIDSLRKENHSTSYKIIIIANGSLIIQFNFSWLIFVNAYQNQILSVLNYSLIIC